MLYLVERLIELLQLRCLRHCGFWHEERRLNQIEVLLLQEVQSIVDECLVKPYSNIRKEVPSMASDFGTTLQIDGTKSEQDLIMRENVGARLDLTVLLWGVCSDDCVVVLANLQSRTWR